MSAEAITSTAGVPPGELAVAQRVRQLQAMVEQARQMGMSSAASTAPSGVSASGVASAASVGGYSQAPVGDFASALQAATTADAGATDAAPLPGESGSAASGSAAAGEYDPLIEQAAARYGVNPAVLHGLIQQESGFDPSAESGAGAAGLTQLMPGTAASLGVANPLNPAESIEGGARYLSQLMAEFGGNTEDALAAYNAGPGAVRQYGGVPPYAETQSYVSKVLGYAEAYRQTEPAQGAVGGLA
jgi:soluble lytic murein transglycosylase-like protein